MRAHHLCLCSSGVEHFLGKEEAIGSNPITGSIHFTLIMEFERAKCVECKEARSDSEGAALVP